VIKTVGFDYSMISRTVNCGQEGYKAPTTKEEHRGNPALLVIQ